MKLELIHEIHDVDKNTKRVNNLIMSVENDDMDEFILPRVVYPWINFVTRALFFEATFKR